MYCINNNGLLIAPTLRRSSVYKSCRPKEDIVLSGMLFMPDIYALQMSGNEKLLQLPDSLDWYGALRKAELDHSPGLRISARFALQL